MVNGKPWNLAVTVTTNAYYTSMKRTIVDHLVMLRRYVWLAVMLYLVHPSQENVNRNGCPTPCSCTIVQLVQPGQHEAIVDLQCQNRDIDRVLPIFHSLTKWDMNFTVDKILLDQNYMRTIPPNIFKGLTIRSISFEGNPLNFIHPDAFAGTRGITDLNFNDCNLTSVPKIFKNIPDIQTLELRGNKLKIIEKGSFEPILNLRLIDLSHNLIENLDFIVNMCSYTKAFTSIVLTENPLRCTCDAYELVQSRTVQLVDGICASPQLFQGMYIGTGTPPDDDEDDREAFSVFAGRTCQGECDARGLRFDCFHSVWTNGANINCYKRPLCLNNKLQCPSGAVANVVRSIDTVNYTEPETHDDDDDDDDDDIDDSLSKNRTRIKIRPTYLLEKMRFQHADSRNKSGASNLLQSRDQLSCFTILLASCAYSSYFL